MTAMGLREGFQKNSTENCEGLTPFHEGSTGSEQSRDVQRGAHGGCSGWADIYPAAHILDAGPLRTRLLLSLATTLPTLSGTPALENHSRAKTTRTRERTHTRSAPRGSHPKPVVNASGKWITPLLSRMCRISLP